MYRISGPKNSSENNEKEKKIVLLQHGLVVS